MFSLFKSKRQKWKEQAEATFANYIPSLQGMDGHEIGFVLDLAAKIARASTITLSDDEPYVLAFGDPFKVKEEDAFRYLQYWKETMIADGATELPITHVDMTRFNISLQDGVNMVLFAIKNHLGGEIFVPKIPSYRILDVASAVAPECATNVIGIRPGEKLHEEMITDTDSLNTIDMGKYYAILPSISFTYSESEYLSHHNAVKVPFGFRYNSETNNEWESIDSLRALVKLHVDSTFSG